MLSYYRSRWKVRFPPVNGRGETFLDTGGCYTIMLDQYGKRSSSARQTELVLRIHRLRSGRRSQARLPLNADQQQEA